jgi:hypothetical protein
MDQDNPQIETTEETQVEETQAEEVKTIIGPDGELMKLPKNLRLGYEKFAHPNKHYRLIWILRREAWLCEEDTEMYRRVLSDDGVVPAGRKLAEEYGVKFREPGQLG